VLLLGLAASSEQMPPKAEWVRKHLQSPQGGARSRAEDFGTIGAPDAMQSPAEVHENLVTKPVAVSRRAGAMVRGAVALHPEEKPAGLARIDHA
jgi:hypothetical protein